MTDTLGALVGIVSMRDLLLGSRAPTHEEGRETLGLAAKLVAQVMTKDVIAIGEHRTMREASRRMAERRIHRVLVRDGSGRVSGLVATRDVMRAVAQARMTTPLRDVMSPRPLCVDIAERMADAIEQLTDANVRGLVVVDGRWPVGVFTHSEALRALPIRGRLLARPVEEVMSYEMLCLDVNTPLYRVAEHILAMNVRRVLAVDHRRLVGIASGFDVVRAAATVG